ncbi:MAG TPA: hypothetical protein PKN36_00745 [bacterium]|nr:hypothetical protein [bacterium]
MLLNRKTCLGIVADSSSFIIAELYVKGKYRILRHTAEWAIPEGIEDAEAMGLELKNFLRVQGITASTAAAGIPARWVLSREKKIPPVDKQGLSSLLTLEAEKDFSLPADELVMDYIKSSGGSSDGGSVFMAAASKSRIQFVSAVAKKAGLRVNAVLPLSMALVDFSAGRGSCGILYLGKEVAEFMFCSGGRPVVLRHLASPVYGDKAFSPESFVPLAKEIEKVLLLLPEAVRQEETVEIMVWDDLCLDRNGQKLLSEALPLPARFAETPVLKAGVSGRGFSAPSAIAELAGGARAIPVNFIQSRMAVARRFKWQAIVVRAAAVLALVMLAATWALIDLNRKENEVSRLREQSTLIEPAARTAESMLKYDEAMQSWRGSRMPFLECLRNLTLSFPVQGKIWVTSIAVREDMKGLVSGKASEGKAVIDFLSALKENGSFSDVSLLYIRRAAGNSGDSVYAISFIFSGQDETAGTIRRKEQ